MNILNITSRYIRAGKLKSLLPEYYQLKDVTESNSWHLNQNVFDHVVGVFQSLETILMFRFLSPSLGKKAERLFSNKVGDHSRKEILMVATLLHDIAKSLTLIKNQKNGITACPGHELIGSFLAKEMSKRFGLKGKELDQVQTIVLYHGLAHDTLTLSLRKGPKEKYIKLFKKITKEAYIELLFLTYADMLGSDLPKADANEFSKRESILIEAIQTSL